MEATGTAFVVMHQGAPYLITNRHNLAGVRSDTGAVLSSKGVVPDEIAIVHNREGQLGEWVERLEPVLDAGEVPLWFEHPVHSSAVDVVALPLTRLDDVELIPLSIDQQENPPSLLAADDVSIVGFPFGKRVHGYMAIWIRGSVASEPALDYEGLPRFLVDARTRTGQSGSPVMQYLTGGMVRLRNGDISMTTGMTTHLLGVYSGRINEQSDLGIVWKAEVILDILAAKARFDPKNPGVALH